MNDRHRRRSRARLLYSTFVDQVDDLSSVLNKCLGAKILLVNPYSIEASTRIEAIDHPRYTLTAFRKEV